MRECVLREDQRGRKRGGREGGDGTEKGVADGSHEKYYIVRIGTPGITLRGTHSCLFAHSGVRLSRMSHFSLQSPLVHVQPATGLSMRTVQL